MALRRGLKFARWIAWAVFFAAAYRLAFWHHDDPFTVFVVAPAFWTLLSAWGVTIFIWLIERKQ